MIRIRLKKFLPFVVGALGLVAADAQINYEPYVVRTVAPASNGDPVGSHAKLAPADMAFDANGNLFVADYAGPAGSGIRKIAPNGAVTSVANGFSGPEGLVFDAAGTLYICDTGYHAIRKILPDGSVQTVAGLLSLNGGYADGPAGDARFTYPTGIAIDAQGFLYVTDRGNEVIRKISPQGTVTTLAGLAGNAGSVDGKGSAARFNEPQGIAVDSLGVLYVTDSSCVRKIMPDGTVTTLAGALGQSGYADGQGTAARFSYVRGITISPKGYLCVVDGGNGRIRKVTPDGMVSTIAGGSPALFFGDTSWFDGEGAGARFGSIGGIEVDGNGDLFVAQTNAYQEYGVIRKVTPNGVVTTLPAATLYSQFGVPDDTGAIPPFGITDLAIDKSGNLYLADLNNTCIHKITPSGVMSTVQPMAVRSDGKRVRTSIRPNCLAVDSAGNIFFFENTALGKITPDGSLTLFAGDNVQSGSADGVGHDARFLFPSRIAFDNPGNLYVADTFNRTIRKITPDAVVTTFAGLPRADGNQDGQGSAARFANPMGITVDEAGNVYVADTYYIARSNSIRKITPDGVVTTFAGADGSLGVVDGVGTAARFYNPKAVVADRHGNIFVADSSNFALRKVTPNATVTTLAGGIRDSALFGKDGIGSTAGFHALNSIVADSDGNLYIADSSAIRVASPISKVRSLNVSTRLQVLENENVLIGGFIVGGSSTKRIIIRALGPSLTASSIQDALQDPTLELYDASGSLIASNDNWKIDPKTLASQQALIESTTVPPLDDREAAICVTLDPQQAYTAVVRGSHGEKGISIVEVYDLSSSAPASLANISTRGFVEPGEKVMIGGFILGGNSAQAELLLRALGPSLAQSGIANPLPNPTLALFDANGQLIVENDDWGAGNAAAIQATGLQPSNPLEAAISIKLPAGSYTAVVGGYGESGVALIEIYNLP